MRLHTLLTERRQEILDRYQKKMSEVTGSLSSTLQLDKGPPALYDELVEVLRDSLADDTPATRHRFVTDRVSANTSRHHAREFYRLGYTVSQLVHGYGCLCQGITEFANEVNAPISSTEFGQLNMCLDVAIAQAVSEYEMLSLEGADRAELLRLGFLAHELRNYLSSAMMAHELIRSGGVGASGATSAVISNSHQHIKEIIDRALAEVRMRGETVVELSRISLVGLLRDIEVSAYDDAKARGLSMILKVDSALEIDADRHLMTSAISNLVQNAIKYTHENSTIQIRAFRVSDQAVIEIEDQCGGMLEGKSEELFLPFVHGSEDQSGLGLGLSIARKALQLNGGTLSARNLPEVGCVFTAILPAFTMTPLEIAAATS